MIEPLVVARGAATALVLAAPAALANVVLASQDPKPEALLNLTLLVLLLGFFFGGILAGREARSDAALHGALAAVLAFVLVQTIGVLGRLDRGDSIKVGGIIFLGFLAACVGTLGALFGTRRKAGRAT